ncbi:hypothetical protein Tco_0941012 [Tanacetum coccineum]|uniref:Retrovirus-related Pol polyprotein from transposon TNT 1-94 n=1 Tax=Tanacetum coccineum TaxID=301880 RepID=A0ABQ5DRY7_9ASTR
MTGAKFDIEKFNGTGDFKLWRIKMRALLIQNGCKEALSVLPADMEAQTKAELNKKAYSIMILCLGNKVLRKVTGETTAAEIGALICNCGVLGEYWQKARILELKRRYFEDYYSEDQYAVSIKEDTAYPCLHSPKTTK